MNREEVQLWLNSLFILRGCNKKYLMRLPQMENVMKEIPLSEAVGHVLCHDLTQIIVGVSKDARFRKGHIVCLGKD